MDINIAKIIYLEEKNKRKKGCIYLIWIQYGLLFSVICSNIVESMALFYSIVSIFIPSLGYVI